MGREGRGEGEGRERRGRREERGGRGEERGGKGEGEEREKGGEGYLISHVPSNISSELVGSVVKNVLFLSFIFFVSMRDIVADLSASSTLYDIPTTINSVKRDIFPPHGWQSFLIMHYRFQDVHEE